MFVKVRFKNGEVKGVLIVSPKSFENACKIVFQNYKQPIISIKEINGLEYNKLADEHIQLVGE